MNVIVRNRIDSALRHALGPRLGLLLEDPTVTDIMLNEDGKVWVDQSGNGRTFSGATMPPEDALAALFLIADHCGEPLRRQSPILSATLPRTRERIAATIAPVTQMPTFAIRKPPAKVFAIGNFMGTGDAPCLPTDRAEDPPANDLHSRLLTAILDRRNILIAGSTGSGKTSLASAILTTKSVAADRCLILEDTAELVCGAGDRVHLLTSADVSMRDLVRLSLRYRPDRIIVGEVRSGDAAIEMIHAMNTGHSGGLATIHANSAHDALGRLEDLCSEVCHSPPTRAIATAIGCVVFVQRTDTGREIKEVLLLDGDSG